MKLKWKAVKNKISLGAFLITVLSCLLLFTSILEVRKYWAKQQILNTISAIEKQRSFQGIVLDTGGLGVLFGRIVESGNEVAIKTINIKRAGSQELRHIMDPLSNGSGFHNFLINFTEVSYNEGGLNIVISFYLSDSIILSTTLLALFLTGILISLVWFLSEWNKKNLQIALAMNLHQMAAQVSHDIRSPLAALDMAVKEANELPEDLRLIIRSSVSRIRDIANNLLSKNRAQKSGEGELAQEKKIETILLSSAIESLVSEKRMQFRSKLGVQIDFDITTESYGLFSKVELREFKRILSNLINNSVEALKEGGNVRVALSAAQDKVEIKVSDNGKGIPPEILAKLGQKGETFGKAEGNGLGLYHARTTLESWGGGLKFESTVGVGTTIIITLLKSEAPSWFVRELKFKSDSRIVVIDDDSSIHQIWDGRFQSSIPTDAKIQVVHLSTPELAREWFKENGKSKATTYLVDFEFIGSDSNGLKLIKELGIEKDSHLVTSRYEEEHILKKCLESNIPLIPKNLSAFVPIKVSGEAQYVEYIYIEDDMLLRMGWERVAKKKKIKLLTLESPRKFEAHLDKIDPETTKIYIDSSLGENEMKGEDFAKVLYEKGYKHLYIATGYEKERFAHLTWLKHSGKDCPFDDEE